MICNKCGNNIDDQATFCPHCGQTVAPQPQAEQPQYAQPQQPQYAQPQYAQPQYAQPQQPQYAQPQYTQPQQPYGQPQPPVYGTPVETNRSLLVYILLSLVTCGIYGYYFIYKLAKDTNEMCAGDGQNTPGLGSYILFSILTCGIYSFFWLYNLQNRYCANAPRYGLNVVETGTTVLMWMIFGVLLCGVGQFFAYHIVFKTANSIGTAYNARFYNNNAQY